MHSIGTIISYCTNDFRFIGKCIEEASKFSKSIVIPVCDHFFDGTPENRQLLEHTYTSYPHCQFIEFSYLPDRLYSPYHKLDPEDKDWAIYWAATTRYIGLQYIDAEYVLFLDSDEIVEGDKFASWLDQREKYDAFRLAAYLYAIRPTLRATKVVNLPLFVKKSTLAPLTLLNPLERIGAYLNHPGPKREGVLFEGKPMVHHYSWVRTREECIQKTKTWGHRNDEDWTKVIEEAFSGKTKDLFRSSLDFEEIEKPYFDPFPTKNVIKIDDRDLFRKEIEHALL